MTSYCQSGVDSSAHNHTAQRCLPYLDSSFTCWSCGIYFDSWIRLKSCEFFFDSSFRLQSAPARLGGDTPPSGPSCRRHFDSSSSSTSCLAQFPQLSVTQELSRICSTARGTTMSCGCFCSQLVTIEQLQARSPTARHSRRALKNNDTAHCSATSSV